MTPESTVSTVESNGPAPSNGRRPKILLADDHHIILDALQVMMRGDFDVLAVDNSQSFLTAVEEFQPDLAILDISMPGEDGLATARRVLERQPQLPIVFLSMYTDMVHLDQAAQVGAKAYLSKTSPAHELMSAINAVLEGEILLTQPAAGAALGKGELTVRQREVLRLIALGSSAKDIANQLNISVRTAEFHRAAIMQRLGLHSTAQMTRYAISNNIA